MITKRMKLKMLRAFFVGDIRKPLRLSPERWAALLGCIFDEGVGVDEMAGLMRQAGFTERRRAKNTFYARPTDKLIEYAADKHDLIEFLR